MKPVPEITRVTIKKSKTVMFVVAKPEVYKGAGDTYVIFGEAKMEDISGKQQAAAAQSISQELPQPIKKETAVTKKEEEEEDPNEVVSEEGISKDDIELVVNQTGVSRAKAVKALREHDKDVVNTIMALTS